jgi:pimeloyl-ACP methyl ester carboxylesterase
VQASSVPFAQFARPSRNAARHAKNGRTVVDRFVAFALARVEPKREKMGWAPASMSHPGGRARMMQEQQKQRVSWRWRDAAIDLALTVRGQGPTVVLFPALSSISTRVEMEPLQERLAPRFRTFAVDWPGFGDLPRPPLDWRPPAYTAYLAFVLSEVVPEPYAVVAAGHAAGYALSYACDHPDAFKRLVLLAPTWRGPLPTMMNGRRPWFDRACRMFDVPGLGALLYGLNVNRVVIRYMAAGHVYADPGWLDRDRLRKKLAVTRAAGARYASVRFVTGALDPLESREEFLDRARRAHVPMLAVYGEETPKRSQAEMDALAAVGPGMTVVRLPRGKLSFYEEFPDDTATAILPFLGEGV